MNSRENNGAVASIGMFDGVHCGHAAILHRLAQTARRDSLNAFVFTFVRHPLATVRPGSEPALLTNISLRTDLIKKIVPEATVVSLLFTESAFKLTANHFTAVLQKDYGITKLIMGFNNCIGSDRRDALWLAQYGNIDVEPPVEPVIIDGIPASSSLVRSLIGQCDMQQAERVLGHPFTIRGSVVPGNALGRQIGYPTANIKPLEQKQIIPPFGVYAVEITLADGSHRHGMANIGARPTINDGRPATLEVNIFDFEGDIYGQTVDISFIEHIRSEKKFDSIEALASQLHNDSITAKSLLQTRSTTAN